MVRQFKGNAKGGARICVERAPEGLASVVIYVYHGQEKKPGIATGLITYLVMAFFFVRDSSSEGGQTIGKAKLSFLFVTIL